MPPDEDGVTDTLDVQTTTVPQHEVIGSPGSTLPEFGSIVPEEYRDKEWVKQVKDVPTMFKMLEDQKAALSRRPAGIPDENASPEKWEEFNKLMGVPEDPTSYDFGTGDRELSDQDKAFHEQLRPLLRQAGVSQRQLKTLVPGIEKIAESLGSVQEKSAEDQDKQFDQSADAAFGDRRPEVMAHTKTLLDKYVPGPMKNMLDSLDNNALITLAVLADGMTKEYVSEDNIPSPGVAGNLAMSEAEKRRKGAELMRSDAYQQKFHPDHDRVYLEACKLYGTAPAGV